VVEQVSEPFIARGHNGRIHLCFDITEGLAALKDVDDLEMEVTVAIPVRDLRDVLKSGRAARLDAG